MKLSIKIQCFIILCFPASVFAQIDRLAKTSNLKVYAQPNEIIDFLKHPPQVECNIENYDSLSSEQVRRNKPQFLFSHTEKKLENYFPNRDFLTGFGNINTSLNGFKVFHLTLLIATPKADKIFGVLEAKDFIAVHLLDGTKVRLQNRFRVNGYWDVQSQSYIYQSQYLIGNREEKQLRSFEVDKILIRWSKARDEYEIFELDFFINQLRCLENH